MDPTVEKNTTFLKLVYLVSIIYPITAVPQIIKIYTTKSADDLSLLSWAMYLVFELVLTAYGFIYKLKPIAIQGTLWIIVYVIILVGIILFG